MKPTKARIFGNGPHFTEKIVRRSNQRFETETAGQ
jgi:hypothetical protein